MQTQRITPNDLEHGQVRIPRATKVMFPDEPAPLDFVLRGQSLSAKWDPRLGPDQERSGVLRVGKATLEALVRPEEVLEVTRSEQGLILT